MKWDSNPPPGYLIGRAGRLLGRLADARLKELGVASGQVPIMACLNNNPPMTQSALARAILIEQPTMAATLARMERDGLIERRPDPLDGRSSLIRLTPAAVAKVPAVLAVLGRGHEEMQAGFSPTEREALLGLLGRVVANLEANLRGDEAAPGPPAAGP